MSLLLALPGELRNRIYEIAVNSCQDAPAHLRHISRGPFPANRPKDWCELTRAFLGLTQTCRQIRKEFLAIHQTRVKVCVDITGIERYCSDMLTHHELGNVVIGHDGSWDGFKQEIDIRELILLASRCHDVKVIFDTGVLPDAFEEMTLPRVDADSQFLRYVAERTDKVELCPVRHFWRHEIDTLLVSVKWRYAEKWMMAEFSIPFEKWFESNPPTEHRIKWGWAAPLTKEKQRKCDWSDKVCEWSSTLGLGHLPVVPWVHKQYRPE